MSTRLIIDGNAVYEIDEDCQISRTGQTSGRLTQESCGGLNERQRTAKKRRRDRKRV